MLNKVTVSAYLIARVVLVKFYLQKNMFFIYT